MSDHDPSQDARNEFLDGPAGTPLPDLTTMSPAERRAFAEELMIASVTEHLLTRDAAATRELTQRSVAAACSHETRRRLRLVLGSTLLAAAAILVAVLISRSEEDPMAPLLTKVQQAAQAEQNHEYRVTIASEDAWLKGLTGSLHASGNGSFAAPLRFAGSGGMLPDWVRSEAWWTGYDGQDYWLAIPSRSASVPRQVLRSPKGLGALSQRLLERVEDLLGLPFGVLDQFLDLARIRDAAEHIQARFEIQQTLAQLSRFYKLEASPKRLQKLAARPGEIDVRAYRQAQAPLDLPETIRMLVDEASGRPRLLILEFPPLPRSFGIRQPFARMQFELVEVREVPADFYAAARPR